VDFRVPAFGDRQVWFRFVVGGGAMGAVVASVDVSLAAVAGPGLSRGFVRRGRVGLFFS
jgi:formiminotetrahydrofolate cyclodeaminase